MDFRPTWPAVIERAMAAGSRRSSGQRSGVRRASCARFSAPAVWPWTRWPIPSSWAWSTGWHRRPQSAVRRDTGATPTPPTPATKYRPPVPTQSLVARNRLIDVLRAAGRRRLVLIHAPSGFGKSTLAAQWREELSRDGVAVGWLTIDDDDNNVVWFLAHLVELIRRVRPALAASLSQVLDEHGDDAARYVLTTLIDELHEKDDRMALVVDDWHRVSDTETIAALGFLLEHGCHHLQIIVTSWSRAGLPVSKLRIRDELVEIDSDSLRFDIDEARSLLNDVGGLQLSDGDVEALTTSTDGWAAALQLAALVLRGGARHQQPVKPTMQRDGDDWRVPGRKCPGHPGTGDGRVPAGDIDHRADLRRAGFRAGGSATRAGDARRDRAARPVPAADRRGPELVSLPPDVRRIPAPPTRP